MSTVDPDGRRVELVDERWKHIVEHHPEMEPYRAEIIDTVRAPDYRGPDPIAGRERYWRRGVGPSAWLRVVVEFDAGSASVVTAFANRKQPPEWKP